MSLAVTARRYWWLTAMAWAWGCSGEVIRLGDGPLGFSATSGGGGVPSGGEISGVMGGSAAGNLPGEPTSAGAGGERDPCTTGQVLASEVVWIGDSWVIQPGTQHTRLTELARQAGTLAPNEDYSWDLPKDAASMADVTRQYEAREAGATKIKVLLMDGGTWDPVIANFTNMSVPAAIDNSIADFKAFIAKVESDGTVQHIVYFLMPELPTIPGVAEMRPELQQACEGSSVSCHFLDLEPLWKMRRDDEPSYTADNGTWASEKGGTVIAEAMWQIMQDDCIAQ